MFTISLWLRFSAITILMCWGIGLEAVGFDWVVEADNTDFWASEIKWSTAVFISSIDFKES